MSLDEGVTAAWVRIERWAELADRSLLDLLRPGSSAGGLAALEAKLTTPLPPGLAASLRRHDGEADDGRWFAPSPLLGRAAIADEWAGWTNLQADGTFAGFEEDVDEDPAIKTDQWWRPAWIPFVGSDGFNLCVDLDPGSAGTEGQVIVMDHETGPGPVVTSSFEAWLSLWADELESGVFEVVGQGIEVRDGRESRAFA